MATTPCDSQKQFTKKDGRCCSVCDAGSHLSEECNETKDTQCAPCKVGLYTATKNHMSSCHHCRVCSPGEHQRTQKECTSKEDTVCACVSGFYCANETCDQCLLVRSCRVGEGVTRGATRTNNTVCAPCEDGTYSNVTDATSPCLRHTSCEEFGRVLKTPGTPTSNAICGDFKNKCQWILPAGLWSGLVLTVFLLFLLICWRKKRRLKRTAATASPPAAVMKLETDKWMQLDLPLQVTEQKSCSQDEVTTVSCTVELFKPVQDPADSSSLDRLDSCQPITPLKASVSFANSDYGNGSTDDCPSSTFFRTYSEPQEDEWCGTET